MAAQVADRRPQEVFSTSNTDGHSALNRLSRLALDTSVAPLHQTGCFEKDRVIKSGYVQKRTQKTKNWKSVFLVLRPNAVSMYKNENEAKLRHQIPLSDLSAVTFLKDPKHKRQNIFGLFSASRNFHFQAPTSQDAQEWVDLIRKDARLDEDDEELFLGGPLARSLSPGGLRTVAPGSWSNQHGNLENIMSSSPENMATFSPLGASFADTGGRRRVSSMLDSSGLSGNEMPTYSDVSDNEAQRVQAASFEDLAVQSPIESGIPRSLARFPGQRPLTSDRTASQASALTSEQESERVVWQGWVWLLRTKGGVRQWKDMWGVLRARKLVLYKDESEYAAQKIIEVVDVVDVVDIDPLSRSKANCLQIITEEKSYRFCAHDEESLVQFLGAFKSLLAKRKGIEARAAVAQASL